MSGSDTVTDTQFCVSVIVDRLRGAREGLGARSSKPSNFKDVSLFSHGDLTVKVLNNCTAAF